ncbi:tRNA (guanine(10)-N2)-methyltransferase homolog [Contarinia nasturtii]|uniref:tRNA (guanine(10)-N2)-methyltransferase homolog n=1 Tax=Contarinia nasturtii TaxID=265458 RepID=UPI0012D408AC|nr:tRNA (guanine(10)-N2)-methyltransferase homolog [Contarinia nasturtii]
MEWKKYILWFAQQHVNFRYAELQSLLNLYQIPHRLPPNICEEIEQPFQTIDLPSIECARQLVSRSVSIRCILEHWSSASNYESFHKDLRDFVAKNKEDANFQQLCKSSFRITVETYSKTIQHKMKVDKIETLDYLPFEGDVKLKNPDFECCYIEFYGLDPNNAPAEPYNIYFGKWVADGNRSLIHEISLKTRKFIGNTSMEPTLSLLMANQAQVKRGDIVFDPFVGTGSLLIAAAKCGGYVMGTDIDYLMLHGKTKPSRVSQKTRDEDESILANLKQYNCDHLYLDVLVSDFSNSIWHDKIVQLDSIITDPPYGIREAREKIETKVRRPLRPDSVDPVHYPSTSPYQLSNLYKDLLDFAAKHLRIGGRLVCWIPIYKSDYSESCIPKSNCLRLIANSEQTLSSICARRLLTYEKIAEPDEDHLENIDQIKDDFRHRFFAFDDMERQEKRIQRLELRDMLRQEAIKRGKVIIENDQQSQ